MVLLELVDRRSNKYVKAWRDGQVWLMLFLGRCCAVGMITTGLVAYVYLLVIPHSTKDKTKTP